MRKKDRQTKPRTSPAPENDPNLKPEVVRWDMYFDKQLLEKVKIAARRHHRTTTAQIMAFLEDALSKETDRQVLPW